VESSLLQFIHLAQTAGNGQQPGGNPLGSLLIMIPLFGLMYFLFIRPQKKRQQQIQEMLKTLKAGDKVMTTSGAFGVITQVSDRTIRILFSDKVEIEFVRSAVAEIINEQAAAKAEEK
jgi:preprotein translocase subunit YajC